MTSYYVVFLYCDARKENDIQHLKLFFDRESAIAFAKKYSSSEDRECEYIGPCGTEYDCSFIGELNEDDDDYESEYQASKRAKEELKVKSNMWYIRIGVSKVDA